MSIESLLAPFPLRATPVAGGVLQSRASGRAAQVTHVLLHGIGSASGSWVRQLAATHESTRHRVLAWDAPGYGASTALAPEVPVAAYYAARLWAWLDAEGVTEPVVLAGHSLGAMIATRAAAEQPQRVSRLVLLAPARGYGMAAADERARRLNERLDKLRTLGPAGMAAQRAAAMLSPDATPEQVAFVRETMAQIVPAGYTQAVHLLTGGDLIADLPRVRCPVAVASGSADTITPPAACAAVATAAGVPLQDLGPVGHVCALQAAEAVNELLGMPLP